MNTAKTVMKIMITELINLSVAIVIHVVDLWKVTLCLCAVWKLTVVVGYECSNLV